MRTISFIIPEIKKSTHIFLEVQYAVWRSATQQRSKPKLPQQCDAPLRSALVIILYFCILIFNPSACGGRHNGGGLEDIVREMNSVLLMALLERRE